MPSLPPNCPACQQPAVQGAEYDRNGVTEASFVCAEGHGWLTKWVSV